VSSETSAIRTQTPGNYPKRNNLHLEHGESLRTRSQHLLLGIGKPRKTCVEVGVRRTFRILTSSQQSGNYSKKKKNQQCPHSTTYTHKDNETLITLFYSVSFYSLLLKPKRHPQHLQPMFFAQCKRPSFTHKQNNR